MLQRHRFAIVESSIRADATLPVTAEVPHPLHLLWICPYLEQSTVILATCWLVSDRYVSATDVGSVDQIYKWVFERAVLKIASVCPAT